MITTIRSTKLRETKNFIKGVFRLSDKTKTSFEIDKRSGNWYQWGNTTDNLCISVPKIEKIIYEFMYNDV